MSNTSTPSPIDVRITLCANGYLAIPIPDNDRVWDFSTAIFARTPTELGALLGTLIITKVMDTP